MDAAKLFFDGKMEIMDIIDTDKSIVKYLSPDSPICPLIGSQITIQKEIGSGAYGKVFLVEIEGMGEKQYVVKKTEIGTPTLQPSKGGPETTLQEIADRWEDENSISSEVIIQLNGGDPQHKGFNLIYVPLYTRPCRTENNMTVERVDNMGDTIIPSGSYLCSYEAYSEYVIGLLLARLYMSGRCINFVNTFGFATCNEAKPGADTRNFLQKLLGQPAPYDIPDVYQYTFMELVDGGDLFTLLESHTLSNSTISALYIQILFAITCYQEMHKMVHGDLHPGNVFIENVNESSVYYGRSLGDASYYKYSVYGENVYIPAIPYIAKIADFGLSCSWDDPITANKSVVKDGMDTKDGTGAWIPNWYCQSYDILMVTMAMFAWSDFENSFLNRIVSWMLDIPLDSSSDLIDQELQEVMQYNVDADGNEGDPRYRPLIDTLEDRFSHVIPKDILLNQDLMGDCLGGNDKKSVLVGTVTEPYL